MKLFKKGKTKDIYTLDNGNYLLKFKNTVTGHPTGESDPGGNSVVGEVDGVGLSALAATTYYFELLKRNNIETHYVSSNLDKCEMEVKPATLFGKGLEFVLRYVATGSFFRRFGDYCKDGDALPKIFEVTLKDDERNDPPIQEDILIALNLINKAQYDSIKSQTITICDLVKEDLKKKGMELYDIKLEFGLVDGKVMLVDEISGGNMRVFKDGKKLSYNELTSLILS